MKLVQYNECLVSIVDTDTDETMEIVEIHQTGAPFTNMD